MSREELHQRIQGIRLNPSSSKTPPPTVDDIPLWAGVGFFVGGCFGMLTGGLLGTSVAGLAGLTVFQSFCAGMLTAIVAGNFVGRYFARGFKKFALDEIKKNSEKGGE